MSTQKRTSSRDKGLELAATDSPNRQRFHRTTRPKTVVEKAEIKWKCPTCSGTVTTYTALTAIPICTGDKRKHQTKEMQPSNKKEKQ